MPENSIELLREENDLVQLKVMGRLDTVGTSQIDTQFTAMISPRGKHALVDISNVSFLASMGIRMLVSVARTLDRHEKRLILYGADNLVKESIDNAGLTQMLSLVSSEEEARTAIS